MLNLDIAKYVLILYYTGDEALPLSAILTWRVQNWSSILGCCHWHGNLDLTHSQFLQCMMLPLTHSQSLGGKLLGLMPLHTCTQSNSGGQGQVGVT